MPDAFTPSGREVPPAGVRGGGEAGPARDRGVRVLCRRGRPRTPRSPATGSGSSPTVSTACGDREAVRKARSIYAIDDRRTCSGPARSSPARTCGCCSTRSPGSTRQSCPHRLVLAGPPGWKPDDADAEVAAGSATGSGSSVRCTASSCSRSSRAPTCTRSRAGTRASASRCWRRWRRGPPVVCSDIPALREVAGDAAGVRRADDVDGWVDAFTVLTRRRARGVLVPPATRGSRATPGTDARARRRRCTARRSTGETAYRVSTSTPVVGDEHGVLELRGARAVGRDRGPAVVPDHGRRTRPW